MSLRRMPVLLLVLGVACASGRGEPNAPAPAPAPVPAAEPATPQPVAGPAEAPPAAPLTAEALYGSCRARVEGPEAAGECSSDEDCTKTGCSGEVCTTRDKAAGMMTTCEVLPCFQVLDTCGCVEGICSWALKEGPVSAGQPLPVPLPPR